MTKKFLQILSLNIFFVCITMSVGQAAKLPLQLIQLPEGFHINIFSNTVPNARSLALGEKGTVFVGTRTEGKVYALVDLDGDYKADQRFVIAQDLTMPNGVAFKDGDLYVAEIHRILRFDDIENHLGDPELEPHIVNQSLPHDRWHGWKFIRFGPDGKLYVPIGAPCNVCDKPKTNYATITRMDPNGNSQEIFAKGIRNTVGFDWHPDTQDLWFTDNGRDMMGDDIPPDELNHAPVKDMHFGFPYCHGRDIEDPKYGKYTSCNEFVPAAQELGPHVAALGMRFYTGDMFPAKYKNQIFIAEHGSWNRSKKIGYRISLVTLENNTPVSYTTFAEGWNQGEEVWGRPVDILNMPDGSLLVSDDHAGAIYRIFFQE